MGFISISWLHRHGWRAFLRDHDYTMGETSAGGLWRNVIGVHGQSFLSDGLRDNTSNGIDFPNLFAVNHLGSEAWLDERRRAAEPLN